MVAKRFIEAATAYRTVLNLSPDRIAAQYGLGIALVLEGDLEAALRAMEQEEFQVLRMSGLALVYHALGQATESGAALEELVNKHAQDAASNIASVHAFRNETNLAFTWLKRAEENSGPELTGINVSPLFASLYDDPRWLPFLEGIGMSPEQLAAIEFKVTLPE